MTLQNNSVYVKKIAILALFTAFAVILSYIETFIPIISIPGVKLGLANLIIVLILYLEGAKEALFTNFLRIVIVGAMFGSFFSFLFSITGAILSFAVMFMAKRLGKLSMITTAILGGVFHNIGQIIIASFVVENYAVYLYLPMLIIAGMITGALIGIVSKIVYVRVYNIYKKM